MPNANPTDDELRRLYADTRTIAVVGASTDPDKPAHGVPAYLQQQGYRVIPVNPAAEEIHGERAVATLDEVDETIDVVEVFRPAQEAPDIARAAVAAGAKVLWLQAGISSDEAAQIAREGGLTVVMDACMFHEHQRLGL